MGKPFIDKPPAPCQPIGFDIASPNEVFDIVRGRPSGWQHWTFNIGLVERVERAAPPRPTMMMKGHAETSLGPLTQFLGETLVGLEYVANFVDRDGVES